MAIQTSDAVANARLDSIEVELGTTPFLDFRTGAQPVNCAAADAGSEIEHMALPSDWMAAASGRSKVKSGVWSSPADATGTAAHFRLKEVTDTTCHMQGSITATGGGGDMELNNISISSGQTITVDTFTLTDGNA